MNDDALRSLPKIDRVVAHPTLEEARRTLGVPVVTELARQAVAEAREAVRTGGETATLDGVAERARELARARLGQRTRRVVNATGVTLHTNLGRAPLAAAAVEAIAQTARGYASLEIDLASGKRGGRAAFVESALATLSGAEAAFVVNNNAGAVLLTLAALAGVGGAPPAHDRGRAVLVSRGELVEIGGGFRIPEVLARSGARMVEVGTTNKTREADYAQALTTERDVAAILRVHPGNFRQLGFVERPSLASLVELAHTKGVAVIEDLGGGLLVDLGVAGLDREPRVQDSIAAGVDVVCFSTDKALGGPQGGAIVGRAELVARTKRDPLARALRLGRLPLAALEATLAHLQRGEIDAIPALAALRTPVSEVRARAERWSRVLAERGVECDVLDLAAVAGGGAFAEESFASAGIALTGDPEALLSRLRRGDPPVVARIAGDRVVLDARTVLLDEDEPLLRAIVAATHVENA